jgi:hypothetical protein
VKKEGKMSNYEEHLSRVLSAVAMEPVDRIPYLSSGTAVNAALLGVPLAKYCTDMVLNCDTNLNAQGIIGEPDGVQAAIFQPDLLATCWLSEVKLPGRDLPENALWQIHEQELVKQSDYDEILEGGFAPWYMKFLATKLDNPLAKCEQYFQYIGPAIGRFAGAGIPLFCGGTFYTPFEMFCGGRTLQNFMIDLFDIPDKLDAVFKLAQEFNLENFRQQLYNPQGKPIAVWIGGWRGTPGMLNPEMFERFAWKYMVEIAELVMSAGVIPLFHLDSDWSLGLKYFRQFPKGKFILALDGNTNIFKAKEAVGGHCCLMGDVPASLLAFGKQDTVRDYCRKLIREVGPRGYIMSSGCDAPYNTKPENFQIMAHSVFEV